MWQINMEKEEKMEEKNNSLENIIREKYLDQRLIQYSKSDYYPFHMPGHKRQMESFADPYQIDITEIEGFDNLHDAKEILYETQKRAAGLYGADSSYLLVNGSTCGILAAVSAAVKKGGKILIARNCHKAVYHAAYLRGLLIRYVYPVINEFGIQGAITPEAVENALKEFPETEAVVITSPTYDGMVSDVEKIAEIVHSCGIPLIVDEAHGAHFGFHPYFPQTAVRLGADLVIQSMHKTLPSMTQTAVLHVRTSLVNEQEIRRFLGIYETSSPSYVLMAGMEHCIRMIEEQGNVLFSSYAERLENFYKQTEKLRKIKVLRSSRENNAVSDFAKILITGAKLGLDGRKLYDLLLEDYHLQMEMCSGSYVLAMTSFMDSEEGFDRLIHALLDIEQRAEEKKTQFLKEGQEIKDFIERVYRRNPNRMEIAEAWESGKLEISLIESVGHAAGEFVSLYPPGIPLLVPGEVITEELTQSISECVCLGLNVQGVSGNLRIKVVN